MATTKTPLTRADVQSTAWEHIEEHMKARIEALRDDLERISDESKAAHVRGRLSELREMLALARGPAEVPRAGDQVGRDPVGSRMTFTDVDN